MKSFTLNDLDIGYADGEKEAENENFIDMFYNGNNIYEKVMEKYKFIISGRKGTGKTILANYLKKVNDLNDNIVDYRKLNEIELHEYVDIDKKDISIDDRILFQEFYLYKQFAISILENEKNIDDFLASGKKYKNFIRYLKYKKSYKKLCEYYEGTYTKNNFKDNEIVTIQKIITSSEASLDANVGANLKLGGFDSNELSREIKKIKKSFAERQEILKKYVLECLQFIKVTVVIDNLDDIRIADHEHLIDFILQLVTKVNDINCYFIKKKLDAKCIILLRDDIIKAFAPRNSNIQKIMNDSLIRLHWFNDSSGSELADMIMHKIRISCAPMLDNLPLKEIRKLVFSPTQNGGDMFDHILKYSFGRPRDVITCISCIASTHKTDSKINMQNFKKSELDYSERLWYELQNEMKLRYIPKMILDIENLIRNFGKRKFAYEELKRFYECNKDKYINIDDDLTNILNYLYELGIIGSYRKSNRKNMIVYWSFRNGGESLNLSNRIIIHYGLQKAFNL